MIPTVKFYYKAMLHPIQAVTKLFLVQKKIFLHFDKLYKLRDPWQTSWDDKWPVLLTIGACLNIIKA
jgi:hypothetical protein